MKNPIISSKKISLTSEYNYFDLLPVKKYQQCNMRIPETVLLQKGFIKDWVFNSHKLPNHPILKKKRQNMVPLAVVKSFCYKSGYGKQIVGCTNIKEVRDIVQQLLKEQKDYDFIKDKKVIEVTTVSSEVLVMTLMEFLDYASENKYSDQNFYEKWKIIQQKVSFTKIDEHYKVENVRNNHVIESKCQKIISVNTTEAAIHSTEIQDDPYKSSSPGKKFQISETKNIEGYKFFDTFLNKKFFNMSQELIDFIQKNFKCLVESVVTKFVINKEREPFLVAIEQLEVKPVKKIADMDQFVSAKEKGEMKIQEYLKCLRKYISQHMDKQTFTLSTPLGHRKARCKGRMCKLVMQEVVLPPLLQQKLKVPTLSANSRVIQAELRDAVTKRKRRVFQKLIQNKVVADNYQIQEESSQYQSSGDNDDGGQINRAKAKQVLKICQNCFTFYFHVNRFFDLDFYGNLVEKKVVQLPQLKQNSPEKRQLQPSRSFSEKTINFINKYEIKKQREKYKQAYIIKRNDLEEVADRFLDDKLQKQRVQSLIEIRPATLSFDQKTNQNENAKNATADLSRLIKKEAEVFNKTEKQIKSLKQLPSSVSKPKLNSVDKQKPISSQNSLANHADTKGNRLLALSKLSSGIKYNDKNSRMKSKTMHSQVIPVEPVKPKRPENHKEAIDQVMKKLQALPDSSKQQLIYFAKKYYKDNLLQPLDRRCYSSYYDLHLYEFMSISPLSIHPKRRIKKRPEMSLKRLSQLTDYPEIVSRSQFIFDTIIVNEQTTIPFCILTTNVVNPENLRKNIPFQNIFIINDIFDCFIEHISMVKQILEEEEMYNKRFILFNYPGQSHTIYNKSNIEGYSVSFCEVLDKLVYRLSGEKNQLKIINLEKDYFKFFGIGYGGFLITNYLGSYSATFGDRVSCTTLVNSFIRFSKKYKQTLQSLLELYESNDPTVQPHAHLYYNKAINSSDISNQIIEQKSGLNPIRVQDRIYLLKSILHQLYLSQTYCYSFEPIYFQEQTDYPVSVIYGRDNIIIGKQHCKDFLYLRNGNKKGDIQNRVFVEIDGGHDIFADNYEDIFRILTLQSRK